MNLWPAETPTPEDAHGHGARHADIDGNTFDPEAHVGYNYSSLRQDDATIVGTVRDHFIQHFHGNRSAQSAGIDVGTGAGLYPAPVLHHRWARQHLLPAAELVCGGSRGIPAGGVARGLDGERLRGALRLPRVAVPDPESPPWALLPTGQAAWTRDRIANFARVRPWADAARAAAVAAGSGERADSASDKRAGGSGGGRPRISTCLLIDDYFGRLGAPAELVPQLIAEAARAGFTIDYPARESGRVVAEGNDHAEGLMRRLVDAPPPYAAGAGPRPPARETGRLSNGEYPAAVEVREAMTPVRRRQPPTETEAHRHSVFLDVELWDDGFGDGGRGGGGDRGAGTHHERPCGEGDSRAWPCSFLAAARQLTRLGLLRDHGRGRRVRRLRARRGPKRELGHRPRRGWGHGTRSGPSRGTGAAPRRGAHPAAALFPSACSRRRTARAATGREGSTVGTPHPLRGLAGRPDRRRRPAARRRNFVRTGCRHVGGPCRPHRRTGAPDLCPLRLPGGRPWPPPTVGPLPDAARHRRTAQSAVAGAGTQPRFQSAVADPRPAAQGPVGARRHPGRDAPSPPART